MLGEYKLKIHYLKEEILFSDLGRVRDIEVSPDGSLILATDGPNGKLIRVIRGN